MLNRPFHPANDSLTWKSSDFARILSVVSGFEKKILANVQLAWTLVAKRIFERLSILTFKKRDTLIS